MSAFLPFYPAMIPPAKGAQRVLENAYHALL
jgi:hypothetical protein